MDMPREEQFVETAKTLIQHLGRLVERAAQDSVANEQFVDTAEMLATLADDIMRPIKPYADVLIPKEPILKKTRIIKHTFMEVDT
jgi:hypothetical protein